MASSETRRGSRVARSAAALAIALLLVSLPYHAAVWQHQHYLSGDNGFQNYPWHYWLATHRDRAYEPVAEMSLGYPLWAEPQVELAYPLNTAWWPWNDPLESFTYKLRLHLALAVVGMFLLARQQGLSRLGSLAAAVVFGAGQFMVHRIVHTPILLAVAWMPWLVWAFARAMGGGAPWLLGAVGLAAMQFLPGHPQMAVATAPLCLYAGTAAQPAEVPWLRRLGRAVGAYLAVAAGMLVLTATLWLPALRHAAVGPRTGASTYGFVTQWGASFPEALVNLVGGLALALKWEKTAFAGTVALAALLLAVTAPELRRWRGWAGAAVAGLVLAWGLGNPLYHLAVYLPVFNRLRGPSRYGVLYAFAGALLAGALVDGVGRLGWARVARAAGLTALVVALAAVVASLGGVNGNGGALAVQAVVLVGLVLAERAASAPHRRRRARAAVAGLAALELAWFSQGVNPAFTRAEWLSTEQNQVYAAARDLSRQGVSGAFLPWFDTLPTNVSLCFEVNQPISFTPMPMPYQDDANVELHQADPPAVLAAYGVGLVAAKRQAGLNWGLVPLREVAGWTLFRNPLPLARAYIPKELVGLSKAGFDAVFRDRHADPRVRALTSGPTDPPGFIPGIGGRVVSIETDSPTQVTLTTASRVTHQVVVLHSWAPGWRATVDGQPADVLNANLMLLSVLVPAGRHQVELRYHPDHEDELALSQRGLACWLVLWLGVIVWRRRRGTMGPRVGQAVAPGQPGEESPVSTGQDAG